MATRRILLLGDVCSGAGREAVRQELARLRRGHGADFVIVNVENVAGGYGVTPRLADALLGAGADCLTTGDHAFDRKDAWRYYDTQPAILRPLNYPPGVPGRGYAVFERAGFRVAVVNLVGRVFMKPLDCPFQRAAPVVDELRRQLKVVVVDFHAEATAEKQAMGWFLDGRVSALLGTHTHVQTADEHVLPGGTAYITDVGMCGAFDSVLGMEKDLSVRRQVEQVPVRLLPARSDPRINGVLVDVDDESGRALAIERLSVPVVLAGDAAGTEPAAG